MKSVCIFAFESNHSPKRIIMKKAFTLATLAIILLLGSCKKEKDNVEDHQLSPNRVISIPSDAKSASYTLLVMSIGHDGKNCEGCIWDGGRYIHRDCMGQGNYCAKAVSVALNEIGTDIIATTTDTFDLTTEGFFLMPSRSLDYFDENNNRHYLNIPEQLVFRDSTTLQFTFTGLSFTDRPLY